MTHAQRPLDQDLPDDLREVASLLDAAGAADRSAGASGLEARIFESSRTRLVAQEVLPAAAAVDALASMDRAAAAGDLEDRAFELSREAVASGRPGTPLRLAGTPESGPVVSVRRFSSWAVRIAAAIALAGAGMLALKLMNTSPSVTPGPVVVAADTQLSEKVSAGMDVLMLAVDFNPHEDSDTDAGSSESDSDSLWMDELFSKESL